MTEPDQPTPELGYEAARDELVAIVHQLEAGGGSLEESLKLWERAEQLATICQHWLDGARERLNEATGQSEAANGSNEVR